MRPDSGGSTPGPRRARPHRRAAWTGAACLAAAAVATAACGQKSPPLPPLVKLPVAPADFTADRRGDRVDLHFTIPATNTDRSKPANIDRVDVYALTGTGPITDAELMKYGTRVGSVDVKAPKDPNDTTDPGEDVDDAEPPTGSGLDQGARAQLDEEIAGAALVPATIPQKKRKRGHGEGTGPLLGLQMAAPARTYLGVGITTKGKRGVPSKRVSVPLLPPPATPSAPTIKYTETAVKVSWAAAVIDTSVLPSYPFGTSAGTLGYDVYDVVPKGTPQTPPAGAPAVPPEALLTPKPVTATEYTDSRMAWGTTRCYVVRAVLTLPNAAIESAPSPETCEKLVDTFPPAAPKQLTAVASEGSISLIWEPNSEADLAGYIVLRGTSPDSLKPITPKPIAETTFKDTVVSGVHYFYAIEAVDKAGNASGPSSTVDETAR